MQIDESELHDSYDFYIRSNMVTSNRIPNANKGKEGRKNKFVLLRTKSSAFRKIHYKSQKNTTVTVRRSVFASVLFNTRNANERYSSIRSTKSQQSYDATIWNERNRVDATGIIGGSDDRLIEALAKLIHGKHACHWSFL